MYSYTASCQVFEELLVVELVVDELELGLESEDEVLPVSVLGLELVLVFPVLLLGLELVLLVFELLELEPFELFTASMVLVLTFMV